jgi:protein-glutamine gamma-glutamyltransferase
MIKLIATPKSRTFWGIRLPDLPQRDASEPIEQSIALRVAVQALVSVGILAADIAAGTWMSLWAVPLGIGGSLWSWRQRNQRNIATKFWLAFGMLVALGAFFARLIGALNDTRLVLAELLVQLQVLHSFDLPRRKDLGYSMMIGLVLLGVAGTISQTSMFGILLIVFLAIALPTLVLDYRSRIGLPPQPLSWQVATTGVSPQQFARLLLIVLGLGLSIFALLPRFPSYQLRAFPVSSAIEFEGTFDNRQINNPGYVRAGDLPNGSGTGVGPETGPGEMDDEFYYGFNARINQNLRGQMTPKVVMRVRSQSPGFWRVLAFDRYTGQGWDISRNDQASTLNRAPWSYRFFLPSLKTAARTQEVVQTYSIVADLPSLIPALATPKDIYFPTRQIAIDPEGGLRAPVLLSPGMTYTVVSEVPFRDRQQLQNASKQYPTLIQDYYLDVPSALAPQLRALAERWMSTVKKPLTSPYEQALFLTQYLKQHYQLQSNLPFLNRDQDLAEAFLFRFQGGYQDHFSTVLTLMLRAIGIPARLAAGFAPGQFNPFTGYYVVQNIDAYALTEAYFPGTGWLMFDAIPGHSLIPPSVEESQTFGLLRQFWNWVAGWMPTPVTSVLGTIFGVITGVAIRAITGFISLFTQGWMGILSGLLLAITIGFCGWLSWHQWQKWRYQRWLAQLPPMERLYQQLLDWLQHQGIQKHPAQTPFEFASYASQTYPPAQRDLIHMISQAYVAWRYGSQTPILSQLQQQLHLLKQKRTKPKQENSSSSVTLG